MRIILLDSGFDLDASQTEKYDLVIGVASGTYKYDDILAWLNDHSISLL